MILFYILLQDFNVSRSTIGIDVRSVRLTVNYISLCSKCIIDTLGNHKRTTVRTVKSDFHILKWSCCKWNQISDVTVSSCCVINSTTNIFFFCQRQFVNLSIDICFNLSFYLCLQLVSFSIDHFNSVIIEWIMACRNHNSTVKVFCSCHIRNTRCCCYVKKICIRSWCSQSGNERVLKHIAAASCIFSDYNLCFVILSVIPAKKTSHFKCVLYC